MKNLLIIIPSLILFLSCKNSNVLTEESKAQYVKMGNTLAKQSFDTLRNSLQNAIAQEGLEHAVSYCNVNAMELTDTYSSDSVMIRRTSLKFRNPENKPDSIEERILNFFASQKEIGIVNDSLQPIVEKDKSGTVHFYRPIILQPICVNCHGNKAEVAQIDLWKTIDRLYPTDLAYAYKPGDLRGIWHIKFIKK